MFRLKQILSNTSNIKEIIYNGRYHARPRRFITSKEARSLHGIQDKKYLPDVRVYRNNIDKNIKNASIIGLTECQSFIDIDKISFNELLYLQKILEDDGFKIDWEECLRVYKIRIDWKPTVSIIRDFLAIGFVFPVVCIGACSIITIMGMIN